MGIQCRRVGLGRKVKKRQAAAGGGHGVEASPSPPLREGSDKEFNGGKGEKGGVGGQNWQTLKPTGLTGWVWACGVRVESGILIWNPFVTQFERVRHLRPINIKPTAD